MKLDIFELLNQISSNNPDYVDKLSEEELKQFSPYVVQMWLKGATSNQEAHIVLTNEFCNPYVFSLAKHKKLLYKLFCSANGYEEKTFYKFRKGKNKIRKPNTIKLIKQYFNYNNQHANGVIDLYSVDDIKEMCYALGLEATETKKVIKEWA